VSRIPIAEQIAAVQMARNEVAQTRTYQVKKGDREQADVDREAARIEAAMATLRFVEKHDAEIRALFSPQRPMRQTDLEDFTEGGRT